MGLDIKHFAEEQEKECTQTLSAQSRIIFNIQDDVIQIVTAILKIQNKNAALLFNCLVHFK